MIYNHIPVTIGCLPKVTAAPINFQYDQVQILQIGGIELPASYRVDFCNAGDDATITMVGTAAGVQIPNQLLATGRPVIAYVVLTGTDENAVETRYQIILPVNRRPPASDIQPTPAEQSTIDSLIEAMNDAVDAAEDAQAAAELAQDGAETAETGAEAQALKAEGYAVGTQDGTPVSSDSPYYENNAEYMKDAAAQYALAADASEGEAAAWATGSYSGDPSGIPVPDDAPQHNNNAHYYKEQAAASAAAAEAALEQFTTPTASASTLPTGSSATASYNNGNFAFGIPKGDKGDPGTDGTDGTDGVSPEVTITSITGGHTVKITDADHPAGQSFNVMNGTDGTDGTDGVSPEVTITSITGGHTVKITDADHPTGQSFNVMDGEDGVSPEVTITSITGGHTVKITDADHPTGQSFNVMDGANTDADDVTYDPTETYTAGSVGAGLNQLNSEINVAEDALFNNPGSDFPMRFEGGTYYSTAVGQPLQKYYGGGYDKTRKVLATTMFDATCDVNLTAKTGYSFGVFESVNGVISVANYPITQYTLLAGKQYGVLLRSEGGSADISAVDVSSIIDIKYVSAIDDINRDIDDINRDIDDINSEINDLAINKAPIITDTASGAIASFPDGADGLPIKQLTAQINPVQDLHGQANPYPAGGGVNKFDGLWNGSGSGWNYATNYIPATPNTTYYAHTPLSRDRLYIAFFDAEKAQLSLINVLNATFTTPENTAYMRPQVWYDVTGIDKVSINYPSSDTAYHPYSNICPISGWTGANVEQRGANLWDKSNYSYVASAYIDSGEIKYGSGRTVTYIPCKPNTTYTAQKIRQVANDRFGIGWCVNEPAVGTAVYDYTFAPNSGTVGTKSSVTITTGATAKYLVCWITWSAGDSTIYTAEKNTFMIEVGSTATDYAPYAGQTLPITFPDEAGTVWGAELTVNEDGSGKIDAEKGNNTYSGSSGESWTFTANVSANCDRFYITSADFPKQQGNVAVESNYLSSVIDSAVPWSAYINNNGMLLVFVPKGMFANVADWETFLSSNNLQVVYPLAEPIEYTLTAEQVGGILTTLKGENNVWSDCNGDTTVEYRADTKLYIDKKLAAMLAALS